MPERLRGFISYSTRDRDHAAAVRNALDTVGLNCFMAHDDIHVSQEWRTRILRELKSMDVFVPLLSAAFKASDWASQEAGFAIARPKVLIIPVLLDDALPYGFLAAYQGRRLPAPLGVDFFRDVVGERFPRAVIGPMITALAGARSFRGAEALFRPLLPYLGKLTPEEAVAIARASTENGEIWDAGQCRTEYLPEFIRLNRHQIPEDVLRPLEYQLEHNSWFDPEA